MQRAFLVALALVLSLSPVLPSLSTSFASPDDSLARSQALPGYSGGYGYDSATATMHDHNGFAYSYMPDGIIRLELPWGYTTFFSFGLTATYLGAPAVRTALDYTWSWAADATETFNDTGVSLGYDYTFSAMNLDGVLDWVIQLEFFADGSRMKVTHTIQNQYANPLVGVAFWYLFDLANTPAPYTIETSLGTVEGPLYQAIPDSVHWVRLSNEFQFDWRDALTEYENGMAYIGDGAVIGLPGLPILGISLEVGDIAPGGVVTIDPYFSGVTRTWNAGAASYSGIAASWDPVGVPATGDNITFDATSTYGCTWNTSVTLGDVSIDTGYTGTVLWAINHGAHDYHITAGSLNCGSYQMILTGNWSQTGGTIIRGTSCINFTGETATFTPGGSTYYRIDISGTVTLGGSGYAYAALYLFENAVLNCGGYYLDTTPSGLHGVGTITSTMTADTVGRIGFVIGSGTIDCPAITFLCNIGFGSAQTNPRTITLSHDIQTTGNIYITGVSSINTGTLITDGYNLTCKKFIMYAYSIANLTTTTITVTSDLTILTNSNFIESENSIQMLGTGTLAIPSTDSFYNLDISGTISMTSSVNVTHDLELTGTLSLAASKYLDFNVSGGGDWLNSGTLAGTGTFYLTLGSLDMVLTLGTVTCPTVIRPAAWATASRTVTLACDTDLEADLAVEEGIDLDPNDMIVTFIDDMTLNLSAASSLWNCTIDAGVTLTLDHDTVVELRATIDGTLAGADFLEPSPAFTSSPTLTTIPLRAYSYTPTQLYWDALVWEEYPDWLFVLNGTLTGVPTEAEVGFYNVSLSLTWNDMVVYQNFTIFVAYSATVDMPWFLTTMSLILGVILGFGVLIVGLVFQMHYLTFLSGLIWLFTALGPCLAINTGWAVLTICLGFILMFVGGVKIAGE